MVAGNDVLVKQLLEKFSGYVHSPENLAKKKFWLGEDRPFPIERWRGIPALKEKSTYTMAMDISGYSPVLGIDCAKYYSEPEANLIGQLQYGIWEYENIPGGRYFENTVFCSLASVYDASLFGAPVYFLPNQAPWYDEKNPVLKEKSDLLKLKPFDFETTGLLPTVRAMYEHHVKATEGFDIKPLFPTTMRSQFSTAIMLRGFENLLMDMIDDPDFFDDLMAHITGVYKEYATARKQYLGEDTLEPGLLGNDEVSTPMVSPMFYDELIFPYEKEIGEFWGGVRYWHSCGQTEAFYETVSTLPGLQLMHIGPWSDIAKAVEVFGPKDISIEICRNNNRDLYDKTEEEMEADLQAIKDLCEGKVKYQVRMDGIAILKNKEHTLEKIETWKRVAKKVFGD